MTFELGGVSCRLTFLKAGYIAGTQRGGILGDDLEWAPACHVRGLRMCGGGFETELQQARVPVGEGKRLQAETSGSSLGVSREHGIQDIGELGSTGLGLL